MDLFEIGKTNNIKRDKFISRFFGIFSEEIANIYFCSPYSEYTNLGRPNISINNKQYILDFTLKNKNNGKIYICEMKCEMQYMNYKRLELNDVSQIHSHKKEAFKVFLDIAKNAENYVIKIGKDMINANGIILLWGKITRKTEKIKYIKEYFNISDILSLEDMINIMNNKNYKEYLVFLDEKKIWVNSFFDSILKGNKNEN